MLAGLFGLDVPRGTSIWATLVQENKARSGSSGNWLTGANYGLNVGSVKKGTKREGKVRLLLYRNPGLVAGGLKEFSTPAVRLRECAFIAPHFPVPLSVTFCGVFAALSFIVIVPVILPIADGVNLTLILQFLPGSTVEQLVVSLKLAVMPILEMVSDAVPVFERVTVFEALVPTFCFPKLRLLGPTDPIATGVAVAVGVAVPVAVEVAVDVGVAVLVAV